MQEPQIWGTAIFLDRKQIQRGGVTCPHCPTVGEPQRCESPAVGDLWGIQAGRKFWEEHQDQVQRTDLRWRPSGQAWNNCSKEARGFGERKARWYSVVREQRDRTERAGRLRVGGRGSLSEWWHCVQWAVEWVSGTGERRASQTLF